MENKNTPIEQQLINVTLAVNPPRKNDVIKGRGNGPNLHSGNVAFRKLVSARKDDYRKSSEFNKRQIVRQIIDLVHNSNPPGRFLTAEDRGIWKLMEYRSILRKVAQALRDKDHIREKETDTEPAIDRNDMVCVLAIPCLDAQNDLFKLYDHNVFNILPHRTIGTSKHEWHYSTN